MKTYQPKLAEVQREWHLIDADGQILGRMSTNIARLLMGKQKTDYAPHVDMGDFVVVTNAAKIKVSGKKEKQKVYQKHSGFPGGFKEVKYEKLLTEQPAKIIENAVRRMLPNNRLRSVRMNRLKVFAGEEHNFSDKFATKK